MNRMPGMTLIAFSGLAGAGKTSAARWLEREHGFARLSFAWPLKTMMRVLTDASDKNAAPPELCGKTLREAYQTLGTEWGRGLVGDDIWLRNMEKRLWHCHVNGRNRIVVDDVRFDNEAELVRENGTVIQVNRPGTAQMDHASEKLLSRHLVDLEVTAGDLTGLHNCLRELIPSLLVESR